MATKINYETLKAQVSVSDVHLCINQQSSPQAFFFFFFLVSGIVG